MQGCSPDYGAQSKDHLEVLEQGDMDVGQRAEASRVDKLQQSMRVGEQGAGVDEGESGVVVGAAQAIGVGPPHGGGAEDGREGGSEEEGGREGGLERRRGQGRRLP